jgi:hypothetical protein
VREFTDELCARDTSAYGACRHIGQEKRSKIFRADADKLGGGWSYSCHEAGILRAKKEEFHNGLGRRDRDKPHGHSCTCQLCRKELSRTAAANNNVASLLSFFGGLPCRHTQRQRAAAQGAHIRRFANEWAGNGINVNSIAQDIWIPK